MEKEHSIDLLELMIEGDGNSICNVIKESVDICLQEVDYSYAEGHIDSDRKQQVHEQVHEEYHEAETYRHTLTSTDNRLKNEALKNISIKNHLRHIQQNPSSFSKLFLFELLDENASWEYEQNLIKAAQQLQNLLNQSLRTRIKMLWCWDEILQAYRQILVLDILVLGNQLIQAAKILEDNDHVHLIQTMLAELDLKWTQHSLRFDLPQDPKKILDFMQTETKRLGSIYENVVQLDEKRESINSTQSILQSQIDTPSLSNIKKMPITSNAIPAKKKNSRMIFHK